MSTFKTPGRPVVDPRVFLSDSDLIFEAAQAEKLGGAILKNDAMAIALTFVDEGAYSFDDFDALVSGFADFDESGEVDEGEEEDYYNALLEATAKALVSLGADPDDVNAFVNDEDSAMGKKIGVKLSDTLDDEILEDADIQMKFAIRDDCAITGSSAIFEGWVKRVKDGVVNLFKKKKKKHVKRTAAQKQALKKAQRKSHTGVANKHRAKSNKVRKRRGL